MVLEFSKWWMNEFKTVKFPAGGTVFDFYIDHETKKFTPWTEKIPKFELDTDIPLQVTKSFFYYCRWRLAPIISWRKIQCVFCSRLYLCRQQKQ